MNCWEFKKCGYGPRGGVSGSALCPAATQVTFNGYNGGLNAGRSCWMVSGTCCDGQTQGTFVDKAALCEKCAFYKRVESEGEGVFLKLPHIVPLETKRAYEGKTVSSKADDEQVILYLLEQLRSKERSNSVRLVTPYKELPISSNAEIVEIRGSGVVMATNELQLAAVNACQETLIGTNHLATFFLAKVKEVDIQTSTVTLNNFTYASLYMDFRKTVRVRLPKPMNVVMHAGSNVISGVIQDISFGGCGMNTLAIDGLDSAEGVRLKLKLLDPATSEILEADIPCEVVRVVNDRPPFKVAVSFIHSAETEKVVAKFIHQRELEIVKELRESL